MGNRLIQHTKGVCVGLNTARPRPDERGFGSWSSGGSTVQKPDDSRKPRSSIGGYGESVTRSGSFEEWFLKDYAQPERQFRRPHLLSGIVHQAGAVVSYRAFRRLVYSEY